MITEAKSEQFLEELNSENGITSYKQNPLDSQNDVQSHIECFSSFGDRTALETMTFSLDNPNNYHKSNLMKKIEEFKLSNFGPEEKKSTDYMTNSNSINEILKPKDKPSLFKGFSNTIANGIKDFSISRQTLNLIIKKEEKKHSILMKIERPLSNSLKNAIFSAFHSNFLFSSFGESQKPLLLENFSCFKAEKAHTILQEGEIVETIYFIENGSIAKLKKGKLLNQISQNNLIGVEMILSINPMICSYVALESCILWGISIKILAQMLLSTNEDKYNENRKFLEPLSFFSSLTETQKDELSFNMIDVKYVKGKTIIDEKEEVSNFFIIKEGNVLVTQKNNFLYYLNKGDSFGDNFFMKTKRNFTVKVESSYVNCLCINKKKFKKILGKNSDNLVVNGNIRMMLKKSFFFSKLSPVCLEKIFKEISVECFLNNTTIQLQTDLNDFQVCFLVDGSMSSLDSKTLYIPGQIIGEELFSDENYKLPQQITTTNDSVMGFINRSQIEKVIGMSVKETIKKKFQRSNRYNSSIILEPKKKIDVNISKLFIIKEIGEGVSGLVFLVKYEFSFYALKIISKGWIVENKLETYIRNEKKIHQKISHPFIASLVTTWKDDISIYFLMEYIQGKELFDILNYKEVLEVSETIYLAASLIITLEYLHMKGIIHRDLKPENIMINNEGILKVCDLGFGKILMSNAERSYTIVGTHNYMSPEMIMGKGYSFLVDYWSVGVLLFEAFYGKLPFGSGIEDPYLICEEILKKKLIFPKEIRNRNVKLLIQQLLSKSPENRLGSGGVDELKAQKAFENINWEGILETKIDSPFRIFMNFTMDNLEDNNQKYLSLAEVLENQDVQSLREMTMKLTSDYQNWDEIF